MCLAERGHPGRSGYERLKRVGSLRNFLAYCCCGGQDGRAPLTVWYKKKNEQMSRVLWIFRAGQKLPLSPIGWRRTNPQYFGDHAGVRMAKMLARSRMSGSERVKLEASIHGAVCLTSEIPRYVRDDCNTLVGLRSKTSLYGYP